LLQQEWREQLDVVEDVLLFGDTKSVVAVVLSEATKPYISSKVI
jgi:hypothetical protein